ncbi:MAG: hypothetical protein JXR19_06135 [Bacteroidia bacterium]
MSLQSNKIIGLLENEESKVFIIKHLNDNPSDLALRYSNKVGFDLKPVLELLSIYKKSKTKLPKLTVELAAMTDRSFQQASSEKVAEFKAGIISGEKLIDLAGGLGVDAMAFSQSFNKVVSIDPDTDLNELVNYNLDLLGIENVDRLSQRAEEVDITTYDWAYIDPDRRSDGKRLIHIEDLKPNMGNLIPKLMVEGVKVAVKMSPLYEIAEFFKLFPTTTEAYVISENGEVKEVLYLLSKSDELRRIHAVEVGSSAFHLEWTENEMNDGIHEETELEGSYIYVPKAALSKSRMANHYLKNLGIKKLKGLELYFSKELKHLLGVRAFEVLHRTDSSVKSVKTILKAEKIKQLNIIAKGSKQSSTEIAKALGIKEGGKDYLFQIQAGLNQSFICRLLF